MIEGTFYIVVQHQYTRCRNWPSECSNSWRDEPRPCPHNESEGWKVREGYQKRGTARALCTRIKNQGGDAYVLVVQLDQLVRDTDDLDELREDTERVMLASTERAIAADAAAKNPPAPKAKKPRRKRVECPSCESIGKRYSADMTELGDCEACGGAGTVLR